MSSIHNVAEYENIGPKYIGWMRFQAIGRALTTSAIFMIVQTERQSQNPSRIDPYLG
ncbi:hypothetical protein M434DRAFT_32799 [Hypoxylon sp. CO27-5]|nr:hypothetical protein M434DRAFT_32799 [Hypoxylon sp. CO27-5]